jgi:rod shape-determining protein MreC
MLAFPARHRPLLLLAWIVLAQVLLLAAQIKREREVRLIRVWAVWAITPLQRAGVYAADTLHRGWSNYVGLHNARRENDQLRAELTQLKLRVNQLEGRAAEAERLETLLGFRETHRDATMLTARVIGASASPASKTIYLNRGESDGVRKNLGVITPDGVVGKVLEAYPDSAQMLLLTDKESGVGALLESSRSQGVVRGTGEAVLLMHYVSNEQQVAIGERILTSGQDRIFPKDLPVGTVVETQVGNPFKVIRVKPAAHLDRLEEVLILFSRQELEATKEHQAPEAARTK